MCTAGETTVKFMAVSFCGPRPLVSAAFTVALMPLAASISSNVLADPIEHGAGGGQEAAIEREAHVKFGVEFLAGRKGQILQVHGEKLSGRRESEEQALAVGRSLDLLEEARVSELFGVGFHVAEIQARIGLQAGGGEQFLLSVLGRALKADRVWAELFSARRREESKKEESRAEARR